MPRDPLGIPSSPEQAHAHAPERSRLSAAKARLALLAAPVIASVGSLLAQEQLPPPLAEPPPLKKKNEENVTFMPQHCIAELVRRTGDPHYPTRAAASRDLEDYFSQHADREGMAHFLSVGLGSDDAEIMRRTELVSGRTVNRIRETLWCDEGNKADIDYLSSLLPEGLSRVPWADGFAKHEPAATKLTEMTGMPAYPLMSAAMAKSASLERRDAPGDRYPTYTHAMRIILRELAEKEVKDYFFASDQAKAKAEAEKRLRELLELQQVGEDNWRRSLNIPPAREKKQDAAPLGPMLFDIPTLPLKTFESLFKTPA